MKALIFLFSLVLLLSNNNCNGQDTIKFRKIKIINNQLDSILLRSIKELQLEENTMITLLIEKKGFDNYIYILILFLEGLLIMLIIQVI